MFFNFDFKNFCMLKRPESIEECSYFTRKQLTNEAGEAKGKLMAWVFKGDNKLNIIYTCPSCGFEGELVLPNEWEKKRVEGKYRKVVEFSCARCNQVIRIVKSIPRKLSS